MLFLTFFSFLPAPRLLPFENFLSLSLLTSEFPDSHSNAKFLMLLETRALTSMSYAIRTRVCNSIRDSRCNDH